MIIESYTREAGRAQPGARDRLHLPQDRPPGGPGRAGARPSRSRRRWSSSSSASRRFRARRKNQESEIGVATGLAWTEVGGELLETEVGLMPGKGKLTLTGKLGDVMQESARAAVSYLRSRADIFGIEPDFNESMDIHLHVPEGAIPKDGPSAGITMATALISALTKIAGPQGRGDDRGDHAARQGPAGGRDQGQGAGRLPRRHQRGDPPRGEREGPGGDPRPRCARRWSSTWSSRWTRSCGSPWTAPSPAAQEGREVHGGVLRASGRARIPWPIDTSTLLTHGQPPRPAFRAGAAAGADFRLKRSCR